MNGLGYDAASEEIGDNGTLEVALQLCNAALHRIDVEDSITGCKTPPDVRLIPSVAATQVEQPAASLHTPPLTSEALRPHRRNHWTAIALGQCIALIAASMNAASFTLAQTYHVKTQLFQLLFIYLFLSTHLLFRRQDMHTSIALPQTDNGPEIEGMDDSGNRSPSAEPTNEIVQHELYTVPFLPLVRLRIPWALYLCFSLVDIIPNFMSLYSFRYASLTSTTLLSSLTVPSTMFFSRLILRKSFSGHHYVGVLLCVLGGTLTVYVDAFGSDDDAGTSRNPDASTGYQHAYVGDLLAIASAAMYGLGDCIAEYSVKNLDRCEYLGMLGLFGALMTGLTIPLLEYEAVKDLFHMISATTDALPVAGLLLWFVASVCLYYVTESRFLMSSDATLLNLSMQSVSLWVYLFTLTTYGGSSHPPPTFFLALVFVGTGVFLYEMGFCEAARRCRKRSRSRSQVEIVQEEHGAVINYQTLAYSSSR
jgi:Solute carrier family 35